MVTRRKFIESMAAVSTVSALSPRSGASADPVPTAAIHKAVLVSMLPKELPYVDRFRLAVDAGFAGIEMQTIADPAQAEDVRKASAQSGLRVHSVMNMDHWKFPLSSADPEVVSKSVAGMETSLRNAKLWGADTVLLVPAVVNPQTSYKDAWTRSQKVIRERLRVAGGDVGKSTNRERVVAGYAAFLPGLCR